jgi:hypothetical protein
MASQNITDPRRNYRSRNLVIETSRSDITTPTASIIQEAKTKGLITDGSVGSTGAQGNQGNQGVQGLTGPQGTSGGSSRYETISGFSTSTALTVNDGKYIFVDDNPPGTTFTLPSASGNDGLDYTFVTYNPNSSAFGPTSYRVETINSEKIFTVNSNPIEPPTSPIRTPFLGVNTKIIARNGNWYFVDYDSPL